MKSRLRRLASSLLPGSALMFAGASASPFLLRGPDRQHPVQGYLTHIEKPQFDREEGLTVMTLNLAHGRSDGFHQALQRRRTIEANLSRVAQVLARERPQVVALQEADGPSLWSGGFDHVRFVAEAAGLPHYVRGSHMVAPMTRYGTAVLSALPTRDAPVSVTFQPSPPTMAKGFVLVTVPMPGHADLLIDVVSVHLDFARATVRQRQVQEIISLLSNRPYPRIILGDFNTDYASESTLPTLIHALDLQAWQPKENQDPTFPFTGKRLDWILTSPSLVFEDHRVLPDTLSDHRAVWARLKLRTQDPSEVQPPMPALQPPIMED